MINSRTVVFSVDVDKIFWFLFCAESTIIEYVLFGLSLNKSTRH